MRALRHPTLQRSFCFGLLFSLTLWLAVPVAATAPGTLAARAAGLELSPDAEAALTEALVGARSAEDFAGALATSLAERPDGEALAALLAAEPEALLALFYGHLFQAFGHPDGPLAVPTVSAGTSGGSVPVGAQAVLGAEDRGDVGRVALRPSSPDRVHRPVALLTSAQPLGP